MCSSDLNNNNQLNFGAYASFRPKEIVYNQNNAYNAVLGVWYRAGESIILSIGSYFYNFKFAISYDFLATNKFAYNKRGKGAFEVSLKYSIPDKKVLLQRGMSYPSF